MFTLNQLLSFVIYVYQLLIPLIDGSVCYHFPLQEPDVYTEPIIATQFYDLTFPCEGYIQKISMHVYSPGSFTMALYNVLGTNTKFLGKVSFSFNSIGFKSINVTQYITTAMIIALVRHENKTSILRDREFNNPSEGSKVRETMGLYMKGNNAVTDSQVITIPSKKNKFPSIQFLIHVNDSTTESVDGNQDTTMTINEHTTEYNYASSVNLSDAKDNDDDNDDTVSSANTIHLIRYLVFIYIIWNCITNLKL